MSRLDYKTKYIHTSFGHIALHYKGNEDSQTACLFLHGHIDTAMEHGTFNYFDSDDENLKILIDHRWCGCSTRLDAYPSLTERCEDIDIVIDYIYKTFTNVSRLDVTAYSQGATILLMYLSRDYKEKNRITNAFALGPRLDLRDYLKWFKGSIQEIYGENKDSAVKLFRSKGMIRITKKFIDEFAETDLFSEVQNIKQPTYIIRGETDDVVSLEDVKKLVNLNNEYLSLIEVARAGHHLSKEELIDLYQYNKMLTMEIDSEEQNSLVSAFKSIYINSRQIHHRVH